MLQIIRNVINGRKGEGSSTKSDKIRKSRSFSEMIGLSLNKKNRNV